MSIRRWSVYILECADGSFYTGATTDVARRLVQHSAGDGSKYVRSKLPIRIAWQHQFKNKSEALKVESRIKKLSRSKKFRLMALTSAWLNASEALFFLWP